MKPCKFPTITLFLLLAVSLFSSCNSTCSCKQVTCPAYNNANFDQWFPYQQAQLIVFTDTAQQDADDTIIINNVSAKQSYEANKGCGELTSGCSSDKYIAAANFSAGYNSLSDWDGATLDSNYPLSVHDFSIQAKGIGSNGFVATSFPSAFYSSIVVNGKTYLNVQTISRTDTADPKYDVYQIYLQKNTGLIAYRSSYRHTLFILK